MWAGQDQLSNEMILDSTNLAASQQGGACDSKRRAFVDVAREAFFTSGYGATSMSAIAARVGGSKTTLWTYFPSKEDLFAAVVDDLIERYGRALEVPLDPDDDVREALDRFGLALMDTLHSEPIIDLHRLAIGEASRFPELARSMYERGQRRGKARLAAFIEAAMARGKLRRGDPMMAGRMFAGMLQTGSAQLHMLGMVGAPAPEDRAAEVAAAVDTFMRAWGPA